MTREEIFDVVKQNILEIIVRVAGTDILESSSMRDFGADSLEIVEVVSRSMKQLQIRVPRRELMGLENLGELVDVFARALAKVQ
jgi:acyl carrier protein